MTDEKDDADLLRRLNAQAGTWMAMHELWATEYPRHPGYEPLTYAEFDAIVRRVVAEEAPLAKVLSDRCHDVSGEWFVAWVSCAGFLAKLTCGPTNRQHTERDARIGVRSLVRRLGEQIVGKK